MKALIVYGSPHGITSATHRLGSHFARGLKDQGWVLDELVLKDIEINHCLGCYGCWMKTPGICVQNDGMGDVINRHKDIDLLVLAAPLYFFSVPGKVKTYWDRTMPLFLIDLKKYKGQADVNESWTDTFKFVLISTCGFPQKENFDGLLTTVKKIYGHAYAGELLVPLANQISQDMTGTKYPEFYDFFYKAGHEYGQEKNFSEKLKNEFNIITNPEYMRELFNSKV